MGSGSSTRAPAWYPGEPVEKPSAYSFRSNGEDNDGQVQRHLLNDGLGCRDTLKTGSHRSIASLPVVELTDWEFIANGGSCAVYACKYRGFDVAAKCPRRDLLSCDRRVALRHIWNEHECLRSLRHPNIVDVYGICRIKGRGGEPREHDREHHVCILMERLVSGTVGDLFGTMYNNLGINLANSIARSNKMKMIPFVSRLDRVLELALALEYIHGGSGRGAMAHRDMKSVNVGFAQDGRLKLLDFGLAKMMSPAGSDSRDTYEVTCGGGSFRYMAPELMKHEPHNVAVDVYSWALVSWEMLMVDRVFSFESKERFVEKVVIGAERPRIPKAWPKALRALLTRAWHKDLHKRPTAEKVVASLRSIRNQLRGIENDWVVYPCVHELDKTSVIKATKATTVDTPEKTTCHAHSKGWARDASRASRRRDRPSRHNPFDGAWWGRRGRKSAVPALTSSVPASSTKKTQPIVPIEDSPSPLTGQGSYWGEFCKPSYGIMSVDAATLAPMTLGDARSMEGEPSRLTDADKHLTKTEGGHRCVRAELASNDARGGNLSRCGTGVSSVAEGDDSYSCQAQHGRETGGVNVPVAVKKAPGVDVDNNYAGMKRTMVSESRSHQLEKQTVERATMPVNSDGDDESFHDDFGEGHPPRKQLSAIDEAILHSLKAMFDEEQEFHPREKEQEGLGSGEWGRLTEREDDANDQVRATELTGLTGSATSIEQTSPVATESTDLASTASSSGSFAPLAVISSFSLEGERRAKYMPASTKEDGRQDAVSQVQTGTITGVAAGTSLVDARHCKTGTERATSRTSTSSAPTRCGVRREDCLESSSAGLVAPSRTCPSRSKNNGVHSRFFWLDKALGVYKWRNRTAH